MPAQRLTASEVGVLRALALDEVVRRCVAAQQFPPDADQRLIDAYTRGVTDGARRALRFGIEALGEQQS